MSIDVQAIRDIETDTLRLLLWQRDVAQSRDPAGTLAVSLLSDVQELISLDEKEEARRLINRVKFVLLEQNRLLKALP